MSLVSLASAKSTSLKEVMERSLSLIKLNFGRPESIAIKPNLCYYYDYSTGETTDPKFVGVLIDVLRKNLSSDPKIFVVESDASAMKCRRAFRMLGYEKMAREKSIALINLSEDKKKKAEIEIVGKHLRFHIPQTVYESDLLVNVPKIKYMGHPKITCALKNIYGCNAYPKKFKYHATLDEAIVGINKLIKSNLVVVDGIIVNGAYTKRLGLVMASEDSVAIDTVASSIMGLNPKSVRHIVLASKEGVGSMEYVLVGEDLSFFKGLFPKKQAKDKVRNFLASVYSRYF